MATLDGTGPASTSTRRKQKSEIDVVSMLPRIHSIVTGRFMPTKSNHTPGFRNLYDPAVVGTDGMWRLGGLKYSSWRKHRQHHNFLCAHRLWSGRCLAAGMISIDFDQSNIEAYFYRPWGSMEYPPSLIMYVPHYISCAEILSRLPQLSGKVCIHDVLQIGVLNIT